MPKSSEPRGDSPEPARRDQAPQRRVYVKPRLTDYGNLRELALAKGGVKSDGHGVPDSKV